MSPYRFAFNNPVFWSDPTGLSEEDSNGQAICPTCPNNAKFKPAIDDPNRVFEYDAESDVAIEVTELNEVEIVETRKTQTTESDNDNWWVLDWLPKRNRNFDKPFNVTLGTYGTVATTTEAWLHNERKALEKRGTKTATNKLNKYVKPSIDKVNKFSKRLGVAGAAYSAGSLGYDIVSGQEITAGQVFDTALSVGLSLAAISSPVGLIALGAYTVIDMYGGFDGIKESLGMDTVIINKK